MSNTNNSFIRKHIQEMPAYQPIYPLDILSDELNIPINQIIKLDANENPYGPLEEVLTTTDYLKESNIYPDPESRRIRKKLAEYHQIDEKSIAMGAGADELIDLIFRLSVNPGDKVINCPPTFGMYDFSAKLNQAKLINVPRLADFSLNTTGIKQSIIDNQPKLIFLSNPNNPDGKLIPVNFIETLLQYQLLVVVDEAYIDFSEGNNSWINKVSQYNNLIVLRTFSKWAGLAGLRIGYGVFPPKIVAAIMKIKQPYNVSLVAQESACISLENFIKLEKNAKKIISSRKNLFQKLQEVPWLEPIPSSANFILCKVISKKANAVAQTLRDKGILIRYFNKVGLQEYIRISVGLPEQNAQLLDVLNNWSEK
jgi:histidinol-phosphate aminotransferase